MELLAQARDVLERARYFVASNNGELVFENDTVLGFVRRADTVSELLKSWPGWEASFLKGAATRIYRSGLKSWNVYSVFITAERCPEPLKAQLSDVEEDFKSTRKIAQSGLIAPDDVRRALYPLLPLQNSADIDVSHPVARLRSHLGPHFPDSFLEIVLNSVDRKDRHSVVTDLLASLKNRNAV